MRQSNFSKYFLLSICLIAVLAGTFQLGQLVAFAVYSNDFTVNSIEIWQVGLISSAVWAVFEFVRTIKKLNTTPTNV